MKDNLKEIEISKETKRFLDDLYYLKDKEKEVKTGGDIFFTKDEQIHHKGADQPIELLKKIDDKDLKYVKGNHPQWGEVNEKEEVKTAGDLFFIEHERLDNVNPTKPIEFLKKIDGKELKDNAGFFHSPWFYKLSKLPSKLPYTDEIIESEGKTYKVIDTAKLEFLTAKVGVKSKLTKVYCAKGGEKIETTNEKGEVESVVVAEKGDAIFYNNEHDQYIPAGEDGKHWKYSEIESHGYSIQEHNDEENYVVVRSNNKALLLVGCVEENSAIKNAFGDGKPQYLYEGATIKKDIKTGNISGIDRAAFENTWEILPEAEARVELNNYMNEVFQKHFEKYGKKLSKEENEKFKKYLEDTWNE